MLETLNFDIKFPTVNNFTGIFLVKYFEGTKHKNFNLAVELVDYISKISQHDYEFCSLAHSTLASAILYVSFVVLEKLISKRIMTIEFIQALRDFTNTTEIDTITEAKKLLILVQNFSSKYWGLNHMKDFQFKLLSKQMM